MFANILNETPLTSRGANDYFRHIRGSSWLNDVSFVTTLRALLADRMQEGETLQFFLEEKYWSCTPDAVRDKSKIISSSCGEYLNMSDFLTVVVMQSYAESWLDYMEKNFETLCEGWHRVEKVTAFFRKVFRIHCFVNPDRKGTILFVETLNEQKMHYLQCGIPTFVPWYIDRKKLDEKEIELLRSLCERTPDKYQELISEIAEKYDFEKLWIQRMLRDFESSYERDRLDRARSDLRSIIDTLASLNDRIAAQLQAKRDQEITIMGLEAKVAEAGDVSEIMDYFLTNKCLSLRAVEGTRMDFVVKTTLDYFDEDLAQRSIANDHSSVYRYFNTAEKRAAMRMLLHAIFIERTLKIRFCAAYSFDIAGTVRGHQGYRFGTEYATYMANPHIDRYRCLGDYQYTIAECLQNHDYIGALEQAVASCRSLNFGDSCVMEEFSNVMSGNSSKNNRCILLPDGKIVNPSEAIRWLKEQQKSNDESTGEGV